ncbi:MAG: protoheme IX farnesyltransferase [Betaproteobacteria bacterium AqS2]|uniref:Protoheme IX farnesyltransferase n=1 Tax=Candidatus Amphirhobacter heronislandensis TaxID=1732024 RepID=A0A930UED4_9GAMM|nr:protoheme IX farnesyltransferase [Betaproteobacteria bacterium AqS2]
MSGGAVLQQAPAAWADYWRLTKPKVVALIVFTALAGMACALALGAGSLGPVGLVAAPAGIGLAALGAAVANCLLERHIDGRMRRTAGRATATGRIGFVPAAAFSLALLAAGLGLLQLYANTLTTLLTLATFVGYAFIYTLALKPRTPQNIVVGGASGAMPPVLGWTAVTGSVDFQPLLLFLIIFVWTPPHFWALALCRIEDYAKAGIPMLPVTHGERFTRLQILLYSWALFAAALLPWATGMAGGLYLAAAVVAGAVFCWLALQIWRTGAKKDCWALFSYSGPYLLLLFLALIADAALARLG